MLRVLTYHRIADPSDTPDLDPTLVSASPEVFERQMEHLRRWYRPVSIHQIIEAFDEGEPLPSRSVHVTFDDAYRDFLERAWPVLRELEIPVTVFVPTAYPDEHERSFWWDRLHRARVDRNGLSERLQAVVREGAGRLGNGYGGTNLRGALRLLPHDAAERLVDEACLELEDGATDASSELRAGGSAVLGWDELRRLKSQGVTFGAHTREHVALPFVDPERIRGEIRRSLDDLTRELGEDRWAFAYPYGMCNPTVARIAREEGCMIGFTCEDGLNRPGFTDPMRLHRSNITPRTSARLFTIRMLPWLANFDRWRHRHGHPVPPT